MAAYPQTPTRCSIIPKPFSIHRRRFLLADPSWVIPRRLCFPLKCFVWQHIIRVKGIESALNTGRAERAWVPVSRLEWWTQPSVWSRDPLSPNSLQVIHTKHQPPPSSLFSETLLPHWRAGTDLFVDCLRHVRIEALRGRTFVCSVLWRVPSTQIRVWTRGTTSAHGERVSSWGHGPRLWPCCS